MYIHLGRSTIVDSDYVIGIFDLDNTSKSSVTRNFLSVAEKKGTVVNVSDEIPKSFVVSEEDGVRKVYISQISPSTLKKRLEKKQFDLN
jgi:hypothetical protein